jgi:trans-aconitate 2-methyltransferase
MDVLEVGCGVGTLTELIADELGGTGSLLAVDLSPKSIELAAERLRERRNVELLAADAVEVTLDRAFDVVVMPDVIEHIPVELHVRLFANVRRWLKDDGWVLIHMPNPLFLEWCSRHRRDLLQEIDQPIHTETLLAGIGPNDLYVHYLQTYSIWVPEGDYQVVVLKPRSTNSEFDVPRPPFAHRLLARARRIFGRRSGRES